VFRSPQRVTCPMTGCNANYLKIDAIYRGDARIILDKIEPESMTLSVWSPPYFVGTSYEKPLTYSLRASQKADLKQ